MTVWSLAKKEFLLLLRDWRAALILLAMPLLFIVVLGQLLGTPDDRIRVTVVDLDHGTGLTPGRSWAQAVRKDLEETAGIRVEVLDSREEAERRVRDHRRAAVLIFEPGFSDRINRCSFLTDGINPFYRDGVYLDKVNATLLKDARQPGQASIIEQVAQVTLLRVILPYMIGKAFDKLSERDFINQLGEKVSLPVPEKLPIPPERRFLLSTVVKLDEKGRARFLDLLALAGVRLNVDEKGNAKLNDLLEMAAQKDEEKMGLYRDKVGKGVKAALAEQFKNYDLTGMTWAALTRSKAGDQEAGKKGGGVPRLGAAVYQQVVPGSAVMFAFFLVMIVGWLFVAERGQGTLKRLRAAPVTRAELLGGKLVPVFVLSMAQGVLLMLAGRLVFGMSWGPPQWSLGRQILWLLPVVTATSLAVTGLALLVATLARTEAQVALYGAVPVLVLAMIGGCVLPREMMPEQTQWLTQLTPQGWALDAYGELLNRDPTYLPNLDILVRSCAALVGFGAAFIGLAWWRLPLD